MIRIIYTYQNLIVVHLRSFMFVRMLFNYVGNMMSFMMDSRKIYSRKHISSTTEPGGVCPTTPNSLAGSITICQRSTTLHCSWLAVRQQGQCRQVTSQHQRHRRRFSPHAREPKPWWGCAWGSGLAFLENNKKYVVVGWGFNDESWCLLDEWLVGLIGLVSADRLYFVFQR